MHVTLRQLRIFAAAAKHLSLTRAAEELHLTQPAVSMQVKQLEESVGLALFNRSGKHIKLTEAGREMFRYSREITNKVHEIGKVMDDLKGLRHGSLKLSAASTVGLFATHAVAAFCARHPRLTVSLDVTSRAALLDQLNNGEVDVVLMGFPPREPYLASTAFMQNPLVVIASPDHPLRTRKAITLKEIAQESFIVREEGSGTRAAVEGIMEAKGIVPNNAICMTTNEAIKQGVDAGLGLAVVSEHTIRMELEAKRLRVLPVRGFPVIRQWYVVHRSDTRLSSSAEAFRDLVLSGAVNF